MKTLTSILRSAALAAAVTCGSAALAEPGQGHRGTDSGQRYESSRGQGHNEWRNGHWGRRSRPSQAVRVQVVPLPRMGLPPLPPLPPGAQAQATKQQ